MREGREGGREEGRALAVGAAAASGDGYHGSLSRHGPSPWTEAYPTALSTGNSHFLISKSTGEGTLYQQLPSPFLPRPSSPPPWTGSPTEVLVVLKDISLALHHMHKTGLAHLSLTPAHILLTEDDASYKLGSLGLAFPVRRGMSSPAPSTTTSFPPSFCADQRDHLEYMAPELRNASSVPPSLDASLFAADVYALGAVLRAATKHRARAGKRAGGREGWSEGWRDEVCRQVEALLGRMMDSDPAHRPSARTVLLTAIVLLAEGGREREDEGTEERMEPQTEEEQASKGTNERPSVKRTVARASQGSSGMPLCLGHGSGRSGRRGGGPEGGNCTGEKGSRRTLVDKEKVRLTSTCSGKREGMGKERGGKLERSSAGKEEPQVEERDAASPSHQSLGKGKGIAHLSCLCTYGHLLQPLSASPREYPEGGGTLGQEGEPSSRCPSLTFRHSIPREELRMGADQRKNRMGKRASNDGQRRGAEDMIAGCSNGWFDGTSLTISVAQPESRRPSVKSARKTVERPCYLRTVKCPPHSVHRCCGPEVSCKSTGSVSLSEKGCGSEMLLGSRGQHQNLPCHGASHPSQDYYRTEEDAERVGNTFENEKMDCSPA